MDDKKYKQKQKKGNNAEKKSSAKSPLLTNPKTILLVEDNAVTQRFYQRVIASLGHSLHIAATGKEALQQDFKQYHLVFLDIGLPDMSGIDVVTAIRQKPHHRELPIVAVTTQYKLIAPRCKVLGLNAVFAKPLSSRMIQQIIMRFLSEPTCF